MKKWTISGIIAFLIVLFLCLKSLNSVFGIFSIIWLALLCLTWECVFIINYVEDYHINFEQYFEEYRNEEIALKRISTEEFEKNREEFIKKYKKIILRDKIVDICKILCLLAFIVICIIAIV